MHKTNATKWAVFAGLVALAAVASVFAVTAVRAQTADLVVSCAGTVSGTQITWSASAAGGNAPYAFAWSGDSASGVTGATSSLLALSYGVNGTYVANIQATDASSSVATSTCSAMVTANVPAPTTSTLNMIVSVNNSLGGAATPANFTVTVGGAGANPSVFAGASAGTAVVVNGGDTYSVGISSLVNYAMSQSGNCAGPIAVGAADACTITEAYVPPTVPSSTLPRANQPMLVINPGGVFLARGMTVTSVASGSFQAQVWGITYTIHWSGNLPPGFYFRDGHGGNATTSPSLQISIGDEVGVSGKVSVASPLVISANVVRDYSLTGPRSVTMVFHGEKEDKGNGKGNDNGNGNGQNKLNDLMGQLRNLQELFKARGGR